MVPDTSDATPVDGRKLGRLRNILLGMAVILGFLQAWTARHEMNPDGISYLDIADAYFRGDWQSAINAYWSPLYSWLLGLSMVILKPSAYWEFSVVHLVNAFIYLAALACFNMFLRELTACQKEKSFDASAVQRATVPERAWLAVGYTLFMLTSLHWISVSTATPDLLVAGCVYLASAILVRIRRGRTNSTSFASLGLVLGLAYLAKAIMFPLAFVFLFVSAFLVGKAGRPIRRVSIALVVFGVVSGPFIAAISSAKGYWTFGEVGKINYARFVNEVPRDVGWEKVDPRSGSGKHLPKKVFDVPAVYEFGTLVGGTYPFHYDPSHWYKGVVPYLDLDHQLRALKTNLKTAFELFRDWLQGVAVGWLALFFLGRRGWMAFQDIAESWFLLVPATVGFGLYAVLLVEARYVAPFVVVFSLAVFSGVRFPDSYDPRSVLGIVAATLLITVLPLVLLSGGDVYGGVREFMRGEVGSSDHVQWKIANDLKEMGVRPGDRVATIGRVWTAYWARLARVRIVAEIPAGEARAFWAASEQVKDQVIDAFAKAGANAIVTDTIPNDGSQVGWHRIGNTDWHAYMLAKATRG